VLAAHGDHFGGDQSVQPGGINIEWQRVGRLDSLHAKDSGGAFGGIHGRSLPNISGIM
jgi:hypothetical protein